MSRPAQPSTRGVAAGRGNGEYDAHPREVGDASDDDGDGGDGDDA
jgi:hypothetical protein